MTAADVLERLDRVKKLGDGWQARCPAHEDNAPSLTVTEGDDGRVLVKCHAGCTSEQVCSALGLELRDLFPDTPSQNGRTKISARYPYVNEEGQLLFEAVRFDPKDFRQRRPDGNGGWVWNLRGVRRVIYRLPEVRAAIEAGTAPIYVVEGERDVHSVEKAGDVATCNPMGAGKWSDAYAEQLGGAGWVVVIADPDEPGIEHARTVAASLRAHGIETTLAIPAVGKDISDHLAAGKALGEIVKLEEDTLLPGANEPARTSGVRVIEGQPDEPRSFPGVTHENALRLKVPPVRQLVRGLVEAATVGTIAGLPETHKSYLGQDLALAVGAGVGHILGREILHGGPVGVWWQDDSTANEVSRVQDIANRRGLTGPLPIRWHFNEGLRLPDDIDALRQEIEDENQVLVIIDSLYNFLPGVKLKDEDVAIVLAELKTRVSDPTGCTIGIVDHAPWPTEGNKGQRRAYGSVFKAAAIRWSIFLEREGDTLYAQASGNNLEGLKRTLVVWDADKLMLRPIETPKATATEELVDKITEFLRRNPGATTTSIKAAAGGNAQKVVAALDDERFTTVPAAMFGKPGNAKCWALTENVPTLLREASQPAGRGSEGHRKGATPEQATCPSENAPLRSRDFREGQGSTPSLPAEGEGLTQKQRAEAAPS